MNIPISYSAAFKQQIEALYHDKGNAWLDNLPHIIAEIAKQHQLSDLKPLPNLSYHYVLSSVQTHQSVILKLGIDEDSLAKEAAALKAFQGFGTVSLLAEAPGWLLLQRAIPGASLKTYFLAQDIAAIIMVCKVMQRLHQAPLPETPFPTIQDWLLILDRNWKITADDLQQARVLKDQLLATMAKPVLLHGDLHHDNILQNGDDWMVIDPKGVIGEPFYEVAAFLRNPIPELLQHPQAIMITQQRIQKFSDILGCSYQKLVHWCFVQAVLAQAWAIEDNLHRHLKYFKKLTELFKVC